MKALARAILDARSEGNRAYEVELRCRLSEAHREAGQVGESIEAALVALDLAEGIVDAELRVRCRILLGGSYMHLNDSVQAFAYLAEAERIAQDADRTDLTIDVMLARSASFGRLRAAEMAYRISADAHERFAESMTNAQLSKCYNNLSASLNDLGRYLESTPMAMRGLDVLDPGKEIDRAFLLANLAVSLSHQDRDREVRTLVEEVESIATRNGRLLILAGLMEELGVAYLGIGRTVLAIECLQRSKALAEVIQLRTMTPTVCKHLARAYEMCGDLPRAYQELREALQSVEDAMSVDIESGIQRALLKHQVEFAKRETELLRAGKEQAERASRAKTEFVATVSHELRTPLNGVLGMTQALAKTPLSPTQSEYVDLIQSSGQTLLQLIGNVLDLSKAEAGKLTLEVAPFDPVDLVEDVAASLAVGGHEKGVRVQANVSGRIPMVSGDAMRLRQILLNLVGNAIKFTANGRVDLRVHLRALAMGRAELGFEVIDSGIGIPAERLSAIFDTFEQAEENTTQRFGGTGLGLTISRRLVERMGGELSVRSTLGKGSTFSFELSLPVAGPGTPPPVVKAPVVLVGRDDELERILGEWGIPIEHAFLQGQARAGSVVLLCTPLSPGDIGRLLHDGHRVALIRDLGASSPSDAHTADVPTLFRPFRRLRLREFLTPSRLDSGPVSEAPLAGLRCLVAEDDPISQKVIRHLLTRLGADALIVSDGISVIDAWRRENFDVILMDQFMPAMDGFQAAARIRAEEPEGRHVHILAMTANASDEARAQADAAGLDGFISKPVSETALITAISTRSSMK